MHTSHERVTSPAPERAARRGEHQALSALGRPEPIAGAGPRLAWMLAAAGLGAGLAWMLAAQARMLRQFEASSRARIGAHFTLREEAIPEAFRTMRPWRTLKLVQATTRVYHADARARVTTLDLRALGLMRVATLLICPANAYAFPLLSLDLVCAGPVRLAAIELIAPTAAQRAVAELDAAHLRLWRDQLASLRTRLPAEWERPFLLDSSVIGATNWRQDQALLSALDGYLCTYLALLAQARPVPAAEEAAVREGLEAYVENLLTLGGPAAEGFKPIVGAERHRAFVRGVMFGLEKGSGAMPARTLVPRTSPTLTS
ncbi:MAG: hypothetical protein HGA45_25910 [Chloroflexales bacterium]|nr:hypothetical protein [Chloroflexales bacterium]